MPIFEVIKGHDAFVRYVAAVEAASADEANKLLSEQAEALDWQQADIQTYDDFVIIPEETTQIDPASTTASLASLNLYLIVADNTDGDNLDSFVSASSPEEAFEHWRHSRESEHNSPIGKVAIFSVPRVATTPQVHGWTTVREIYPN